MEAARKPAKLFIITSMEGLLHLWPTQDSSLGQKLACDSTFERLGATRKKREIRTPRDARSANFQLLSRSSKRFSRKGTHKFFADVTLLHIPCVQQLSTATKVWACCTHGWLKILMSGFQDPVINGFYPVALSIAKSFEYDEKLNEMKGTYMNNKKILAALDLYVFFDSNTF